jgi:hypothetical protein
MPVYYIPVSSTASTIGVWSTWTSFSVTTASSSTGNYARVWLSGSENSFADSNWTSRQSWIAPQRLYIASRTQAVEDELRHYYELEQRRQAHQVREQHSTEARDRSRELLLSHLTPAQRETFERNKWFIVEGGLSKQRYRIRALGHMVANIDVLSGPALELVSHRLCGHCDLEAVPLFDQLLAQKMMLELDEERFLKVANRHRAF